jgi:tungstate transport system ATP-binding protein
MEIGGFAYRLQQCVKCYGDVFRLSIPDLVIDRGEALGVVGHNGSGKSTLLKILAFLEPVDRGDIHFGGAGAEGQHPDAPPVTMLFQNPYLLRRSVFENVAFGLRVRGVREHLKASVTEALELVGLSPRRFCSRKWFELSGGEAQRVALAARLALHPQVLLLDEPTANVDHQSASQIKHGVSRYRRQFSTTLVITSHDSVWLNSVSDRIIRMHDGRIVGAGNDNLLDGPWYDEGEGLWYKKLPDGQLIHAVHPPDRDASGILNSSNIMISTEQPERISAQNILRGTVDRLSAEFGGDKVRIEVNVSGVHFTCSVTHHAASTLRLLPGRSVWILFKASSISWY